jgi:hypothetical protein
MKFALGQPPLSIEPQPSPLSSRGADLPAASQEWNERVDIEPLPTHECSCFVSGHDFSRAAHSPQRWALAPVPILEHILFIRSEADLSRRAVEGSAVLRTLPGYVLRQKRSVVERSVVSFPFSADSTATVLSFALVSS